MQILNKFQHSVLNYFLDDPTCQPASRLTSLTVPLHTSMICGTIRTGVRHSRADAGVKLCKTLQREKKKITRGKIGRSAFRFGRYNVGLDRLFMMFGYVFRLRTCVSCVSLHRCYISHRVDKTLEYAHKTFQYANWNEIRMRFM